MAALSPEPASGPKYLISCSICPQQLQQPAAAFLKVTAAACSVRPQTLLSTELQSAYGRT